jgi:hypothetical protein
VTWVRKVIRMWVTGTGGKRGNGVVRGSENDREGWRLGMWVRRALIEEMCIG